MFPQNGDTATTSIDAAFVATANRIGSEVYTNCLHTSPWLDLTKQTKFDESYGVNQQVLLYDRALPTVDAAGNADGVTWFGTNIAESVTTIDESQITGRQPREGTPRQHAGAYGGDVADPAANLDQDQRSFIQFSRRIKQFQLRYAEITAPKINLQDLRYAAQRQQQITAIMEVLTEATAYTWENRNRDEYEIATANVIFVKDVGTVSQTKVAAAGVLTATEQWENNSLEDISQVSTTGIGETDATPNAFPSNRVFDRIYTQLIRRGAGKKMPYGMENGRPIFACIMPSELSYAIKTEAGFRDDARYDSAKVSDLLAPLGIEKSHRGFYHMVDDLAPRYNIENDKFVRVYPYTTVQGITIENEDYDKAKFSVAYIHHQMVCESQIPNPFGGAGEMSFDAKTYTGKFGWYNIKSEQNPDCQIGYFRGSLASATKPIKTEYGFTIVYERESETPAG